MVLFRIFATRTVAGLLGVGAGIGGFAASDHDWVAPTSNYSIYQNSSEWNSNWDLREKPPSESEAKTNGTVHHILLVRHGQYVHGKNDKERVLTDLGKRQAELTGKRIRSLIDDGELPPITRYVFSTMSRATETAEIIAKQLELGDVESTPCSLLREGAVFPPNPEPVSWKPSVEEFRKDGIRVEAAFLRYFHRPDEDTDSCHTTVLVCHGNVIRYCVMRALQLPPEAWLRTAVYNGSITALEVRDDGRVSLRGMGDVGFLNPKEITYQ